MNQQQGKKEQKKEAIKLIAMTMTNDAARQCECAAYRESKRGDKVKRFIRFRPHEKSLLANLRPPLFARQLVVV